MVIETNKKIRNRHFPKVAIVLAGCLVFCINIGFAQEREEISGELRADVKKQAVFEIQGSDNLSGTISILSNPGSEVLVSYRKSAVTDSKSQSGLFLDLIDLELLTGMSDRIILKILTPRDSPWEGSNYSVGLEITAYVPEDMAIEGFVRFMGLVITGPFEGVSVIGAYSATEISGIRGAVKAVTSFANLNVYDINGEIKIENHHGGIEASDLQLNSGVAIFRNSYGSIIIQDINGALEAYTDFSEIRATDIKAGDGSIVLRTNYGSITAEDISGELVCETSFNTIRVSGCRLTHGHSKIETNYSKIDADFESLTNCDLFISNTYNNINLSIPTESSVEIVASVDNGGRINVEDLPIRPTTLQMQRFEGYIGDSDSRVELKINGIGTINLMGK